jgi:UDPglucose 6-dehydrogenase
VLFDKMQRHFAGQLQGRKIAMWGLAFKPRTDDIREAPSLVLIQRLLAAGTELHVHDPVAGENIRQVFGDRLAYHEHHYDTLDGAEALVIVTEWNEYRNPDLDYVKYRMSSPVIFDGRNLFDPSRLARAGFQYTGIGLSQQAQPDAE